MFIVVQSQISIEQDSKTKKKNNLFPLCCCCEKKWFCEKARTSCSISDNFAQLKVEFDFNCGSLIDIIKSAPEPVRL